MKGARILLLGVSYKANISDQRETPARPLAAQLRTMGAEVRFFDPPVDYFEVDGEKVERVGDLGAAVADADLAVLLQPHREFLLPGALDGAPRILDTSGRLVGDRIDRL